MITQQELRLSRTGGIIIRHQLDTDIDISASPADVWHVLTDLDSYAQWNPFIVQAGGELVVGAKLVNRLEPPGGKGMTFKPTLTVVEEATSLEWLGRPGVPGIFDGRHRFELVATASGGTHLIHSEQFSGALVRFMRTSLDKQTRGGFLAMNEVLKTRAEALAGARS